MTITIDIDKLNAAERLELIGMIWDGFSTHANELPVTHEQAAELDRRLAELDRNPSDTTPWDVAKSRILAQL